MRIVFSIIVGVFIAFAGVAAFESVGSVVYPVSGDIAATDRATLLAVMASVPFPAKVIVATGWLVSSFVGAWFCLRIADVAVAGWIVTGVFVIASVAEQVSLPHPLWMEICAVALPLLGGWLAQRLHARPYPGEPLLG